MATLRPGVLQCARRAALWILSFLQIISSSCFWHLLLSFFLLPTELCVGHSSFTYNIRIVLSDTAGNKLSFPPLLSFLLHYSSGRLSFPLANNTKTCYIHYEWPFWKRNFAFWTLMWGNSSKNWLPILHKVESFRVKCFAVADT